MYNDHTTKYQRTKKAPKVFTLTKTQLTVLTILAAAALIGAGHYDFQAVQLGLI